MTKQPRPSLIDVHVTAPDESTAQHKMQRESLHVRIPVATTDRIREAAHKLRREKQDITDEALREWLAARGF